MPLNDPTNYVLTQSRGDTRYPLLVDVSVTPGANKIPRANGSGKLSLSWIPQGSGSGLDADTLDGVDSAAFALDSDLVGLATTSYVDSAVSALAAITQPLDGDLSAIAALTLTGFAKRTGSNTWTVASLVSGDIPDLSGTYLTVSAAAAGYQPLNATLTGLAGKSSVGSGSIVLATSPTITTPTIAKLANLISNGFVKTSGGDGTLSVDTNTYLTGNQTITLSGDASGSGETAISVSVNWPVPGTIGSTTPNTGAFTTLSATGLFTVNNALGNNEIRSTLSSGSTPALLIRCTNSNPVLDIRTANQQAIRLIRESDGIAIGRIQLGVTVSGAANLTTVEGSSGVALGSLAPIYFLAARSAGVIISDSILATAPAARLHVWDHNAATNALVTSAIFGENSSGTAAAGFGQTHAFQLSSSTTVDQLAAAIDVLWQTATHASRAADLVLSAYNVANKREGLRIRGGSSGAQIGLFGATPVSQQTALGTTTGFTAATGTAVLAGSTFTGGSGSSAYTIGDIVLALKNLGALAA